MTTPQEDWRERFDEIQAATKYTDYTDKSFCCGGDYCEGDHNGFIKNFIATEIAAAVEEERLRHCCCIIENSKVVEFCKLHSDLIAAAEERVLEKAIEKLTLASMRETDGDGMVSVQMGMSQIKKVLQAISKQPHL